MRPLLLAAGATLSALGFYLWTETDSPQSRAKQDASALQKIQRELAEARAELAERTRQLESSQASLEAAQAQLAHTRAPSPNQSPHTEPAPAPNTSSPNTSPFIKNLVALAQKAADIDRRFKAFPELDIPEIALLTEIDWINVASQHSKLETADQIRRTLEKVTLMAKQRATGRISQIVQTEMRAARPVNLEALAPKLQQKLTAPMLERYELLPVSRIESSWMQQPAVQEQLQEQSNQGRQPQLVIREKETAGNHQQVLIFFSSAQPGSEKPSTASSSSVSMTLDREGRYSGSRNSQTTRSEKSP